MTIIQIPADPIPTISPLTSPSEIAPITLTTNPIRTSVFEFPNPRMKTKVKKNQRV